MQTIFVFSSIGNVQDPQTERLPVPLEVLLRPTGISNCLGKHFLQFLLALILFAIVYTSKLNEEAQVVQSALIRISIEPKL